MTGACTRVRAKQCATVRACVHAKPITAHNSTCSKNPVVRTQFKKNSEILFLETHSLSTSSNTHRGFYFVETRSYYLFLDIDMDMDIDIDIDIVFSYKGIRMNKQTGDRRQ